MEVGNLIKYEGNNKYFIALYKSKDEKIKFFIVYALTNPLEIIEEKETVDIDCYNFNHQITMNQSCQIKIPIKFGNNCVILGIQEEKDYNLIKSVVESLA